jgi:16S rRNA (guanine1207-N2)-methyltransferase
MKRSAINLPYDQAQEFLFTLRGQSVRVFSKPGIPQWDRLTIASQLLAENIRLKPADKVLLLGCGHGALAACLARLVSAGSLQVVDTSLISIRMTVRTLAANAIHNARVNDRYPVLQDVQGTCDVVAMVLPKGRKLARRWLAEAYSALKAGGCLYLAGPSQEGIQSVAKDAASLFGECVWLSYKKRNRVACLLKKADLPLADRPLEWVSEPGVLPGTWRAFQATVRGKSYTIHSLPGVFSCDELDEGTLFLLENVQVRPGSKVLDFGCGYGILGLVAASLGAGQVDLVDVNLLAVASAQENIRLNGQTGISVFPGDGLAWAGDHSYDLIVSNPPFHSGKEVEFDVTEAVIDQARRVLSPGGRLVLVANRFLRYDRQMRLAMGNVESIAQNNRFHVLSSELKPQ